MVTVFKNQSKYDFQIDRVLGTIQNPSTIHKEFVTELRERYVSGEDVSEMKRLAPNIMWAGQFNSKKKADLIVASNFVYIDVDTSEIEPLPFIYAYWKSITQRGYGVLVKSTNIDKLNYNATYNKIGKMMNVPIDKQASNINRVNFASYDENLYINPQSKIVESVSVKSFIPTTVTISKNYQKNCENILKILDRKNIKFVKGNRHHFIVEFAIRADMMSVPQLFTLAFLKLNGFRDGDEERVVNSIYKSGTYTGKWMYQTGQLIA